VPADFRADVRVLYARDAMDHVRYGRGAAHRRSIASSRSRAPGQSPSTYCSAVTATGYVKRPGRPTSRSIRVANELRIG
jgi:hypothetical protein